MPIPTTDPYAVVNAMTDYLTDRNGCDQAEQANRLLKVGAEVGEAFDAWAGVLGQNPRKPITHTVDDVADELADVALTAIVAAASLGYDPAAMLARRAETWARRLAEAGWPA